MARSCESAASGGAWREQSAAICVRHLLETLHVRYQSQRKVAGCTATSFTKLRQAFTVLDVNDRFPQTGSLDSVVNRH
jgi:hypothetical protein